MIDRFGRAVLIAIISPVAFMANTAASFAGGGLPNDWQGGAAVIVAPKYEGSKDYEVIGVPIVAPAGLGDGTDGRVQFRGPDDIRLRVLETNGFEAGPLAGWRFDREEDDSSRLTGLDDVDGGFVVGGYAAYRIGMFRPFLSYHHQVSGDDTGGVFRFGSEVKLPLTGAISVTATGGASYGDDDYFDAYFSVTPAQSFSSGLAAFDADAGIKDVFIGLSSDVPIGERWSLKLSGRYTQLVGDASDSPVVEDESQFSGLLGLTYRFRIAD